MACGAKNDSMLVAESLQIVLFEDFFDGRDYGFCPERVAIVGGVRAVD